MGMPIASGWLHVARLADVCRILAWRLGFWERGLCPFLHQLVHVAVHLGASMFTQLLHRLDVNWCLIWPSKCKLDSMELIQQIGPVTPAIWPRITPAVSSTSPAVKACVAANIGTHACHCSQVQISSLEIMVVLTLAACCSGSWSGNFKDAIVVDAHIFQHSLLNFCCHNMPFNDRKHAATDFKVGLWFDSFCFLTEMTELESERHSSECNTFHCKRNNKQLTQSGFDTEHGGETVSLLFSSVESSVNHHSHKGFCCSHTLNLDFQWFDCILQVEAKSKPDLRPHLLPTWTPVIADWQNHIADTTATTWGCNSTGSS